MKPSSTPAADRRVWEVRPASRADLDAVLPLMIALYDEDGGIPPNLAAARRALEELLEHPELGRMWVALPCGSVRRRRARDGEPVAYVVLTLGFSLEWHGRDAFVDELYVAPDWRGRGLGRALLATAEDEARRAGIRALHLEVEPANERARTVYERAGYEDNGRRLATKRL